MALVSSGMMSPLIKAPRFTQLFAPTNNCFSTARYHHLSLSSPPRNPYKQKHISLLAETQASWRSAHSSRIPTSKLAPAIQALLLHDAGMLMLEPAELVSLRLLRMRMRLLQ